MYGYIHMDAIERPLTTLIPVKKDPGRNLPVCFRILYVWVVFIWNGETAIM
jgi:hypothetical protein